MENINKQIDIFLLLQNLLQIYSSSLFQIIAHLPRASCRYFCPTSLRYSSIAFVASVFSLKMRCSFSPQRSTSDIIKSVRKSCRDKQKSKSILHIGWKRCSFMVNLRWQNVTQAKQHPCILFSPQAQKICLVKYQCRSRDSTCINHPLKTHKIPYKQKKFTASQYKLKRKEPFCLKQQHIRQTHYHSFLGCEWVSGLLMTENPIFRSCSSVLLSTKP